MTKIFYSTEEAGEVLGIGRDAFLKRATRHNLKPMMFNGGKAKNKHLRWTLRDIEAVRNLKA